MKYYVIKIDAEPYTVKVQIAYKAEKWAEVLKVYPSAEYVREIMA